MSSSSVNHNLTDRPKILIYSSERSDKQYFVILGENPPETATCTCEGFIYRRKCKHISDAVRRYVRTETRV